MHKTINAAVVGVGRMGQYHVGAYSEMTDVNIVGVVDTDRERGMAIAAKYRTDFYPHHNDLIGKADIVSVAVPTAQHYEVARDCLEAGINCLVEKPIYNNLAKAEELFAIAEKNDLALHVGHVERFNGAVQELKNVVNNPICIESRRMGPYDSRIQGDGVVLDMMIHDIDIILNLVDSPVAEMNVMGASVFTDKDDVVNVQLKFKNGCIANILASRATQEKIRTMAVTQEEEYVFLDYTQQDILVHRRVSSQAELTRKELRYRQEALIERIFVHRENPLKLELRHLIDCASNGAKRHTSVESELKSLKVALQVLEKLRLSKAVPAHA